MQFRTLVEYASKGVEFQYGKPILWMGSCFAENIGNILEQNKFACDVNPFGILYNPASIARALRQIMEEKVYTSSDLFQAGGRWHSWMHHSSFSSSDSEECARRINERISKAASCLPDASWLVVTWGTAYVFQKDGEVVGNCHKQPERMFVRRLLSVESIYEEWNAVLRSLKHSFPQLKIMFSVSPIRHVKDGMHGNQISKSTLLLAIHRLCEEFDFCHYFPAYEIMMDELRDYRFYADDMLHPSSLAVGYIWQRFCELYLSGETLQIMKQWEDIRKGLSHRPFDADSDAYRKFLSQIVLKIEEIRKKFPYFDVKNELEQCRTLLKI